MRTYPQATFKACLAALLAVLATAAAARAEKTREQCAALAEELAQLSIEIRLATFPGSYLRPESFGSTVVVRKPGEPMWGLSGGDPVWSVEAPAPIPGTEWKGDPSSADSLAKLVQARQLIADFRYFVEYQAKSGALVDIFDEGATAHLNEVGSDFALPFDSSWQKMPDEYLKRLAARVEERISGIHTVVAKRKERIEALTAEKDRLETTAFVECPLVMMPVARHPSGRPVLTEEAIRRFSCSYDSKSAPAEVQLRDLDFSDMAELLHGPLPSDATAEEQALYAVWKRRDAGNPDEVGCKELGEKLNRAFGGPEPSTESSTSPPPSPAPAQPLSQETGPLPFDRKPSGAPIMTADLIERYLKARAGGNAKETAYWRLGRFDTFGYTDVESRISVWLIHGETPRRFEFLTEAELNALESRRADIERVYY